MTTTSGAAPGLEDQLRPLPPPAGSRRGRRHRRPTGEAPPLPRHLAATGVGWLVAAIGLIAVSLLVFTAGRSRGEPEQLASEASFALGFTTRQELGQALSQRSSGRLTLDAAAR